MFADDLHTHYTLYCVCMVITSRQNWGAAAKKGRSQGAVGFGHVRLVLARGTITQCCWCIRVGSYTRLMQTVKEVRPIKHTYVCNEERNVMCQSVLTQTEMRVCQM